MKLYTQHISAGGKKTYHEYHPATVTTEMELDNKQIATLAGTIGTCMLMGLERHLPEHALLSRRIKATETALQQLASTAGTQLDNRIVDAAVVAWGAAMQTLALELSKCEASNG